MFTLAARIVMSVAVLAGYFAAVYALYKALTAIGTRFINASYRKFGVNGGLAAAVTWVAGLATVTTVVNRRIGK